MKDQNHNDKFSSQWVNLAEERLGSKVLFATDDFFAEKENLIKSGRGNFIEDKYTERGKWMDGWESRRKRDSGHDYCTVKLGLSGVIRGVDIDTNHFLGNHPPQASLEACCIDGEPNETTKWTEVLGQSPLDPGSQNLYEVKSDERWTHVRLHIYPDGGVARLRVYGDVSVDFNELKDKSEIDLVAIENGGHAVTCNDMFFSHKDNLIVPGRGVNMGDGWETKRRREPGHDWVVLRLGAPGIVNKILVDTAHFKGNYPDSCMIEGINLAGQEEPDFHKAQLEWKNLLPQTKLSADNEHAFSSEVQSIGPVTHVRMNIYPDGGISRLRLVGELA